MPMPQGRRSDRPAAVLVSLLLGLLGTACSSSTLQLYARPNGSPPGLSDTTVAVLPAISFGGDPVNALIFDRANARVFSSGLGRVRFVPPDAVAQAMRRVPESTSAFERWSRAAEQRRFFRSEGDARVLHDGKQTLPGGVTLDQKVHFRSGGGAVANLLPARIDPRWFGDLRADYLLASMTYTKYRRESGIYALFGILPFAGYSYGGPADIRAHYAIYDRRSGARLWEAYFGVETRKTRPAKWPNYPLDPRTGPAIIAAWTLANDAQGALVRLVAEDPRRNAPPLR